MQTIYLVLDNVNNMPRFAATTKEAAEDWIEMSGDSYTIYQMDLKEN